MAQILLKDVQYLAQLSSLRLGDEEAEALRSDLEDIIDYITLLGELDTSGVEPTYQVTGLENVWREDEIDDYGVGRDQLLSLASESQSNQIKVPKVL